MKTAVQFPTITINKPYKYISSRYHNKNRTKLRINNHYKQGNNYYNAMVLINKDGSIKIESIIGQIKGKDNDIILSADEPQNIINTAYNYAKENNYLWTV